MNWTANPVFSDFKKEPTMMRITPYVDHFFGEIRFHRVRKPLVVGEVSSLYEHCVTPPVPQSEHTSPVR